MVPGSERTVPGRKAMPFLGIGCLGFAVGMGILTYALAQWTTPYFQRMEKERLAREGKPADRSPKVPAR